VKKPFGVILISSFMYLSSFVLLSTSIFYDANANEINIAMPFALSRSYDRLFRIVLALATLVMIYGYIRLRKWGFWAMISYSFLFGAISMTLSSTHHQQSFNGNMIWSILVLLYTIHIKEAFFQNKASVM